MTTDTLADELLREAAQDALRDLDTHANEEEAYPAGIGIGIMQTAVAACLAAHGVTVGGGLRDAARAALADLGGWHRLATAYGWGRPEWHAETERVMNALRAALAAAQAHPVPLVGADPDDGRHDREGDAGAGSPGAEPQEAAALAWIDDDDATGQ